MANLPISVELRGEVTALEILAGVNKHAKFAQLQALRAAGRKGRSDIARTLVQRWAVPLKVFRNRVRYFAQRSKKGSSDPIAHARLWVGVRFGISVKESPAVLPQLKIQHPTGFEAKKITKKKWFYRVNPTRRVGKGARTRPRERGSLPIREHKLDWSAGTLELVHATARRVMKTTYVDTFKKDYKRRIDKIRQKR